MFLCRTNALSFCNFFFGRAKKKFYINAKKKFYTNAKKKFYTNAKKKFYINEMNKLIPRKLIAKNNVMRAALDDRDGRNQRNFSLIAEFGEIERTAITHGGANFI